MHEINENKNRPYNKMKVNKRKYKKIKKKGNKTGGGATAAVAGASESVAGASEVFKGQLQGVTNIQQSPIKGTGNPEIPPHFMQRVLNHGAMALSLALMKWKGITQYIKGLKEPTNLFCGLFPNNSSLRKLFETYLGMKRFCPGLIGGNSKNIKNKTRKKRKKLSYKFRKITNKNNYIGGGDKSDQNNKLDKRKVALEIMKQKKIKLSLEQSIPMIKERYYNYFNTLEVTHLYELYFTLINIKNAAIYQILLDFNLQKKIGEVYKSFGDKKKALKSLSSEMRLEITKKYEKADLFMGFQWFNYNYHAITDTQTTPSLLDSQILGPMLSGNSESVSTMFGYLSSIYGHGEINKDSLEAFLFLNANQMNISKHEKDEREKNVQTLSELLNEESVNDEDLDKLLTAIGRIMDIQAKKDTEEIIKSMFFKSRKIYNSSILFGKNRHNKKNCHLYFWEQIPKTYKNISQYMNAFDVKMDILELKDTKMLSDLKLEFKKGLYPHMHEFDIQTTSAEQMNKFMERINSPNYNIFKDTFFNVNQLISTYKFIEYSQLIYIIEVVLFKKIYFNKFLSPDIDIGQGIQLFFEKDINYLIEIDTENDPENIDKNAAYSVFPKHRKYAKKLEKSIDQTVKKSIQTKFQLLYNDMESSEHLQIKDLLLTRPDKGEPQSK